MPVLAIRPLGFNVQMKNERKALALQKVESWNTIPSLPEKVLKAVHEKSGWKKNSPEKEYYEVEIL